MVNYLNSIDKSCLVKKGANSVDWNKSIGCNVNFYYEGIVDKFTVYDHNAKQQRVGIMYKGSYYSINTSSLLKCKLGVIVGLHKRENFKFKIDDVVNGHIKITSSLMKKSTNSKGKAYTYLCLIDGYNGCIFESDLIKGQGCPVCANKKVKFGINDMCTTNPELGNLLANPDDGYKYTQYSGKRVDWVCSNCKAIIKDKRIRDIALQGLSCPKCSDGISYPEKFVFNVLSQLNYNVICQYSNRYQLWIPNNNRYDFAIEDKNCIIEVHGKEHYDIGCSSSNWTILKDVQDNDYNKMKNALDNKIANYVVLDARESSLEWIKKSILQSQLPSILNFSEDDIDWDEADKLSQKSIVKDVCDLWNSKTASVKEIENNIKIVKKNTIIRYLKIGNKYGWCEYNPQKQHGKKIMNLKTGEIFYSVIDAMEKYDLSRNEINKACSSQTELAYI